ncbi:dUTPase-like protein, partial [Dimargaris cristalligena]
HPKATLPNRGTQGSAGYGLYIYRKIHLSPHSFQAVAIGWARQMPSQYHTQIRERSSLGIQGIAVRAGIIDSDYRGEISVVLHNLTATEYTLMPQAKIAQLLFIPNGIPDLVEVAELDNTQRGNGSFSST